jgi:hypothetical protein
MLDQVTSWMVGNWEVDFWLARQNEAAGAADAAA